MAGLTARQERFVEEYLVDLNATQAAIRAGYSKKTAQQIATENLSKPVIAAAIQAAKAERAKRTEIEADDVVRELARLGFANMLDYIKPNGQSFEIDLTALTRDQAAAIHELVSDTVKGEGGREIVRTKLKLADKRAALVELGKHLGIFERDNRQKVYEIHFTEEERRL